MSTTTLILIVVIAIIVILVLRAKSESKIQGTTTSVQPEVNQSLQPAHIQKIVELITSGRKIEAIKAYRDATGVGLEEAKSAIERYDPIMKRMGIQPEVTLPDWSHEDWAEIDALLEAGNKIGAIRLYRQKTGCDLKEAKDAIDIRDDV
ncbi:MAG TPA: hypothetical protein VMZ25_10705 [Terriglobales bacterium]|nr:hypothetical protein [Terriglobales bacterium]